MRHLKRIGLWSGAGLLVLALLVYGLVRVINARCFALVGESICHVDTASPLVALSFDDGPSPVGVAAATTALREAGAHGTFFLVGTQIEQRPQLVREILATGNEVGNHSYSHVRMIARSAAFYDAEIARTDAALRQAGVAAPRLFRPPYGKKLIGLPQAVARHGYRMILWDIEDPRGMSDPADYATRVIRQARPGSIILMHVMSSGNVVARAALPLVLRGLQARGFRVVTVGELLRRADRG